MGLPYATTVDLMRHLTAATPDSLAYAITDYFETITLWDVKTDSVTATKLPGGDYRVTVVGTAGKLRADSHGAETPVAMGDYIDVGGLAAPKAGAHRRAAGEAQGEGHRPHRTGGVHREVAPRRGGIDPYNLLIDRNPGDNSRDVRN